MIDVTKLTEKHRLVMRGLYDTGTYETGLFTDNENCLRTTATGLIIRWDDRTPSHYSSLIAKVIDPPLIFKPGMVLVPPEFANRGNTVFIAERLPDKEGREKPWLVSPPLSEVYLDGEYFYFYSDEQMAKFVADGILVEDD
jgi:hypothetical protein